jgi:hypothetical protein
VGSNVAALRRRHASQGHHSGTAQIPAAASRSATHLVRHRSLLLSLDATGGKRQQQSQADSDVSASHVADAQTDLSGPPERPIWTYGATMCALLLVATINGTRAGLIDHGVLHSGRASSRRTYVGCSPARRDRGRCRPNSERVRACVHVPVFCSLVICLCGRCSGQRSVSLSTAVCCALCRLSLSVHIGVT